MNWAQLFMATWFKRQYVALVLSGGDVLIKRAYLAGRLWYAHPYLPNSRVVLLPDGKTYPEKFIVEWLPVTAFTEKIWRGEVYTPEDAIRVWKAESRHLKVVR